MTAGRQAVWVAVACGCIVAMAGAKKPKGELKVTTLEMPEECTDRVAKGDIAHIVHKGLYKGKVVDQNPELPDGSPEPLEVKVGKGRVLTGMDMAIEGMCLNEKIEAKIPPHLGYDDPTKQFSNKPVPDRSWVTYQIQVIKIDHPSSLAYLGKSLFNSTVAWWPFWVAVGFFMLARNTKLFKARAKGKKEARNEAKKEARKEAKKKTKKH